MEFMTYTLPAHWASALVNDDRSGLTDDDERELDSWLDIVCPGYCVGVNEEPEFCAFHDADTLPDTCLEFTFEVPA